MAAADKIEARIVEAEKLRTALVEALGDDDPIVQIALGTNLVEVSWPCDLPEATPHRVADNDLLDFGLWLSEELTGTPMSRIDLESCLADWATTREDADD